MSESTHILHNSRYIHMCWYERHSPYFVYIVGSTIHPNQLIWGEFVRFCIHSRGRKEYSCKSFATQGVRPINYIVCRVSKSINTLFLQIHCYNLSSPDYIYIVGIPCHQIPLVPTSSFDSVYRVGSDVSSLVAVIHSNQINLKLPGPHQSSKALLWSSLFDCY